MTIHFTMPFASPEWPLVAALRAGLGSVTVDCGRWSTTTYQSRLSLVWLNLKLVVFAFASVRRALRQRPVVTTIVVSTDAELIGASLASVLKWPRPRRVLLGFIYTARASSLLTRVRLTLFRAIVSLADGVICYSRHEAVQYTDLFRLKSVEFVSIPYGLHVTDTQPGSEEAAPYVLSAGRSGRDYATLLNTAALLPAIRFKIICDSLAPLKGLDVPANVEVVRTCVGGDYFSVLRRAQLVVVPLNFTEISSGQMVLLQAKALGKATIITRTPTSVEYGEHLRDLYFVQAGSSNDLREAITLLVSDDSLRAAIGARASQHFQAEHSMAAFARNLVGVTRVLAEGKPGPTGPG